MYFFERIQQFIQLGQEMIQHQDGVIQNWQGIVQLIQRIWYEIAVRAQYMKHAKNEAIADVNSMISSIQQEKQQAEQLLQLIQQIDDNNGQLQQVQQQLQELIQHQNSVIQNWQGIVQLIQQNWSESDVGAQYMKHAKNEAIADLNSIISSIQHEKQQAEHILQLLQQ